MSYLKTALLLGFMAPGICQAERAGLGEYFEKKIAHAENAMQSPTLSDALRRARIETFDPAFTAQASFGVSDVLQITVAPELDLVFVPLSAEKPSVPEVPVIR